MFCGPLYVQETRTLKNNGQGMEKTRAGGIAALTQRCFEDYLLHERVYTAQPTPELQVEEAVPGLGRLSLLLSEQFIRCAIV